MPNQKTYKILYFNTEDKIGGGEISLIGLLAALKKEHHNTTVACPSGELANTLREMNANVIPIMKTPLKKIRIKFCKNKFYILNPLSCFHNMFTVIRSAFRFHEVMKKVKPHLIHANTPNAMLLIALPSLVNNIPVAWHIRILPLEKLATEKIFILVLSLFAKKIIAISEAIRERLVNFGVPSNKVSVVYNPIDTKLFYPRHKSVCRKKFDLPLKSTIIGSIGRLHQGKGYETFLKAATYVKQTHKPIRLLIAGQEWEEGYRAKLVNLAYHLDLTEDLILMDWQQDASCLISSLDILILAPTRNEGFGRTLAEAMACEVPVIGSRLGGINEIIEDKRDGLLVSPDDENSLAKAIITLLDNKKFSAQLAEHGRKKVKTKFASPQHVRKIIYIYSSLIKHRYSI